MWSPAHHCLGFESLQQSHSFDRSMRLCLSLNWFLMVSQAAGTEAPLSGECLSPFDELPQLRHLESPAYAQLGVVGLQA